MIKEFIRFKRNIDRDIEDMWDLMICGHAKSVHHVSAKVKFLNFVINIVGIFLAFVGMGIISIGSEQNITQHILILLAGITVLPIIVNSILQATIKIIWLNVLLCLISSFVIGLILGAIVAAL